MSVYFGNDMADEDRREMEEEYLFSFNEEDIEWDEPVQQDEVD